MCHPAVMVGLTVASAAASMYGKKKEGEAAEEEASRNAALANTQRSQALQQGVTEASQIRTEGRQIAGQAQAAIGASGVEGTTGSMGNIFAVNSANAAMDAERAKANAVRSAWGFGKEAEGYTSQIQKIRRGTLLGQVGIGIGGASQVAGQVYGSKG